MGRHHVWCLQPRGTASLHLKWRPSCSLWTTGPLPTPAGRTTGQPNNATSTSMESTSASKQSGELGANSSDRRGSNNGAGEDRMTSQFGVCNLEERPHSTGSGDPLAAFWTTGPLTAQFNQQQPTSLWTRGKLSSSSQGTSTSESGGATRITNPHFGGLHRHHHCSQSPPPEHEPVMKNEAIS